MANEIANSGAGDFRGYCTGGLAGLAGFAVLFFPRVGKEERMMLENFGPQYLAYMERTKKIIPYLY